MAFVLLQHLGPEQVAARANAAKLEDRNVLEHESHGLAHEASLERIMHQIVLPMQL